MNAMSIISLLTTIAILGLLYWRMVKREIPEPVGWLQALVPIAVGIVSHTLSQGTSLLYLKSQMANPNAVKLTDLSFVQSLGRSFLVAGGNEELWKLVMILVILFIFRKKVKNVYEFVLIGACVGIGFTLIEEFDYGSEGNIVSTIGRMISVPAHMSFNMLMAEFLGKAKYSKLSGKGSPVLWCILAFVIPSAVHTLYDACTIFNSSMMRGEVSGVIMAMAGYAALLVYEFIVLLRFKKKTAAFCGMSILAEETAA